MSDDPIVILNPKPHANSQVAQTRLGWTIQQPDGAAAACGFASFGDANTWLAEVLNEN